MSNNSNVQNNDFFNKIIYIGIKLIILLYISILLKTLKVIKQNKKKKQVI